MKYGNRVNLFLTMTGTNPVFFKRGFVFKDLFPGQDVVTPAFCKTPESPAENKLSNDVYHKEIRKYLKNDPELS